MWIYWPARASSAASQVNGDGAALAAGELELKSEPFPGWTGDGEGPGRRAQAPHTLALGLSVPYLPPPTLHSKGLPRCPREPITFLVVPNLQSKRLSHLEPFLIRF